jgi:dephospho-CoA kinase
MKRIGLTGGIGAGKSLVAKLFHELGGIPVLDADEIARNLRASGGEAELPILNRFGTLDRTALRTLISTDPQAKKDLESILHPLIQQKSEQAMRSLENIHPSAPFLIYEASLIIESGRLPDFDGLIVVTSPLPDRLSRIMARDGVSKEAALAMIDAQKGDSFRLKHATHLIENLGTVEDLKSQVLKVLEQIKSA